MGEDIRNAHILRGLKKFHDFFISQDFYSKNEEYFEKFNIVPKRAKDSTVKGMEKIWAIDQKYLKCWSYAKDVLFNVLIEDVFLRLIPLNAT